MNHSQWKTARTRALLGEAEQEDAEVTALRLEIRYAMALGQAVYDRRTVLGLSTGELAGRANLTEARIEAIEDGDTVPTLPLLHRLATALESQLDIHLASGRAATVRFEPSAA
ncbi:MULTISPECIES: helix-turn-helix domain-containing protein [Kitasatospora]|uniref:Putative transcriptional regulator n=1 Tax=Kitasatospora setae (strain ATCC 33774 / DSM 43861 / JCM 3304 / KCC A-0304 / NBRC 14216 / KM-6054) TaxID=452652 RepID=E4NCA6_KITSK|nr:MULTISPECIES: helix-turn-helix domain-containing protein [Kitasatospora]BAJ28837.1 putative transcriptional regulator [Kitasatospora setae KM-6054]